MNKIQIPIDHIILQFYYQLQFSLNCLKENIMFCQNNDISLNLEQQKKQLSTICSMYHILYQNIIDIFILPEIQKYKINNGYIIQFDLKEDYIIIFYNNNEE